VKELGELFFRGRKGQMAHTNTHGPLFLVVTCSPGLRFERSPLHALRTCIGPNPFSLSVYPGSATTRALGNLFILTPGLLHRLGLQLLDAPV
jgi:hypothetical protein